MNTKLTYTLLWLPSYCCLLEALCLNPGNISHRANELLKMKWQNQTLHAPSQQRSQSPASVFILSYYWIQKKNIREADKSSNQLLCCTGSLASIPTVSSFIALEVVKIHSLEGKRRSKDDVLNFFFCLFDKHHNQSNLGEEQDDLAHTSRS